MHRPTDTGWLGITAKYTHTRVETLRSQVGGALSQWPESLEVATDRCEYRWATAVLDRFREGRFNKCF